jgi:hypothetical protein
LVSVIKSEYIRLDVSNLLVKCNQVSGGKHEYDATEQKGANLFSKSCFNGLDPLPCFFFLGFKFKDQYILKPFSRKLAPPKTKSFPGIAARPSPSLGSGAVPTAIPVRFVHSS